MGLRRWLVPALLLSVGVNLGLLIGFGVRQFDGGSQGADGWRERRTGHELAERTPEEHQGRMRFEALAQRLDLEGATREEFIQRQQRFLERTERLRRTRDEARRGLHRALTAEVPDQKQVAERLEVAVKASAEMEKALVEHVLEARELLDGEAERRYLRFLEHLVSRRGERARRPGSRRRPGDRSPPP